MEPALGISSGQTERTSDGATLSLLVFCNGALVKGADLVCEKISEVLHHKKRMWLVQTRQNLPQLEKQYLQGDPDLDFVIVPY